MSGKTVLQASGKTHKAAIIRDIERQFPSKSVIHHPLTDLEAVFAVVPESQPTAHSAASSLALLRFFPSYQYRADKVFPWTVTRLDHAVRPPAWY